MSTYVVMDNILIFYTDFSKNSQQNEFLFIIPFPQSWGWYTKSMYYFRAFFKGDVYKNIGHM